MKSKKIARPKSKRKEFKTSFDKHTHILNNINVDYVAKLAVVEAIKQRDKT